jgi:hypothetical protein
VNVKYRQGDVLIARIDTMPEGVELVGCDGGRVILAYGEVTGHAHAVEGDVALFAAADVSELEERFLRVEREARVVHEEHDAITLPPGIYVVRRQREYTPSRVRPVED